MSDNPLSIGSIQVGLGDTRAASSGIRVPDRSEGARGSVGGQQDLLSQVARLLELQKAGGLKYNSNILQQSDINPHDFTLSASVTPEAIRQAFKKLRVETMLPDNINTSAVPGKMTDKGFHDAEMVMQAQNALLQFRETGQIDINYGEFFVDSEQ